MPPRHPNQYNCLVAALLIAVFGSLFVCFGQAAADKGIDDNWPCLKRRDLLRDSHGRPQWLGSSEIMDRVLRQLPIERPGPLGKNSLQGVVRIRVLINKHGRVLCANGVEGHPIGIGAVIHSARKWTFRPYTVDGKRKSVAGVLTIPYNFSSS